MLLCIHRAQHHAVIDIHKYCRDRSLIVINIVSIWHALDSLSLFILLESKLYIFAHYNLLLSEQEVSKRKSEKKELVATEQRENKQTELGIY